MARGEIYVQPTRGARARAGRPPSRRAGDGARALRAAHRSRARGDAADRRGLHGAGDRRAAGDQPEDGGHVQAARERQARADAPSGLREARAQAGAAAGDGRPDHIFGGMPTLLRRFRRHALLPALALAISCENSVSIDPDVLAGSYTRRRSSSRRPDSPPWTCSPRAEASRSTSPPTAPRRGCSSLPAECSSPTGGTADMAGRITRLIDGTYKFNQIANSFIKQLVWRSSPTRSCPPRSLLEHAVPDHPAEIAAGVTLARVARPDP